MLALAVVYGINSGYTSSTRQGLIFILFGSVLAFGAVYSWAYLPNVQRRVPVEVGKTFLETKTLEELGEGRGKAQSEGEIITVRDKIHELRRRQKEKRGHIDST